MNRTSCSWHTLIPIIFILQLTLAMGAQAAAPRVTVRNGWLCVDGEPFYMKGVCYFENHTVDNTFERSSPEIIDYEFGIIKAAGFNTILSQLNATELALARKHGLMVVQYANHLCFSSEYRDPKITQMHVDKTREVIHYSKDFDHILFYIIDNEPAVQTGIF
ncbi:MAG: hypothetical protein V2A34_04400, partial [Lentisphaerota bacterium]